MRHPGSSAGRHGAPLGLVSLHPSDGLAIGRLSMWFAPHATWGAADACATAYRRRRGPCRLLGDEQRCVCAPSADAIDPERPCGLRAACHLLPPPLAAGPPRIARLGVPIALEKGADAIVAPDIAARLPRPKAALGLVVQHRDELAAIVGLAAQRLLPG